MMNKTLDVITAILWVAILVLIAAGVNKGNNLTLNVWDNAHTQDVTTRNMEKEESYDY